MVNFLPGRLHVGIFYYTLHSVFMGSRQEPQSTTELHGSSRCLYSDHVSAHDLSFDLELEPNKLFMRVYLRVSVCCFTSLFTHE